jgi:hypothetical protein
LSDEVSWDGYSRDRNFLVAAGTQVVYYLNDRGHMIPDPRPIRRQQNDHADLPARQILLMTKISICGDESMKPFRLCAGE